MTILNKAEITKITGCATKKNQINALKLMNVPFSVRPDGWPVTSSEQFNSTLGATSSQSDDLNIPKFDALGAGNG